MATIKTSKLVDLACRLGVIEDSTQGRRSYATWVRRDPVAAQRAVVAALPDRPATAPTSYPSTWAASVRAGHRQRVGATSERPKGYPSSWIPRASARVGRITVAND